MTRDIHHKNHDLETIFQIIVLSLVFSFDPSREQPQTPGRPQQSEAPPRTHTLMEHIKDLPIWKESRLWEQIFIFDCDENTKTHGALETARLTFKKVLLSLDKFGSGAGAANFRELYLPEVITKSFRDMEKFMFELDIDFAFTSRVLLNIGLR